MSDDDMAKALGVSIEDFKALVKALAAADLDDPEYRDFLDLERWAEAEAAADPMHHHREDGPHAP